MVYRVPGCRLSSSAEVVVFFKVMFFRSTPSWSVSRTLKFSIRPCPTCQEMLMLSEDNSTTCRPSTAEGAVGHRDRTGTSVSCQINRRSSQMFLQFYRTISICHFDHRRSESRAAGLYWCISDLQRLRDLEVSHLSLWWCTQVWHSCFRLKPPRWCCTESRKPVSWSQTGVLQNPWF